MELVLLGSILSGRSCKTKRGSAEDAEEKALYQPELDVSLVVF